MRVVAVAAVVADLFVQSPVAAAVQYEAAMKQWHVVINALVRRTYLIEADDQDDAIRRAWRNLPTKEEEIREDIMVVHEVEQR